MNLEKELAKALHLFKDDFKTKADKDAFSSGFTYGFKKGNQSHIRKLQED